MRPKTVVALALDADGQEALQQLRQRVADWAMPVQWFEDDLYEFSRYCATGAGALGPRFRLGGLEYRSPCRDVYGSWRDCDGGIHDLACCC